MQRISCADVQEMILAGGQLVDVRSPMEFHRGALPGAVNLPVQAIREMVASAIDIIVQQTRFADGSRRVVNITEITGVESGIVAMQDIFKYQQEGFDDNGRVKGRFMATGAVPEFYEEMRQRGLNIDMSIFQ